MKQTNHPIRRSSAKRPSSSGVTLIELLTVVAVLAVIAAILLPVLANARAAARQATCLSNTRQLGHAIAMYAGDFDEVYPPYFDSVVGSRCEGTIQITGARKYWPELVSAYVAPPSGHSGENGQALIYELSSLFICPEWSGNLRDGAWPLGNIASYGINDHLVNWWTPSYCGGFVSRSMAEVVEPTRCLLLTETFDWFSTNRSLPGAALALSSADRHPSGVDGATATLAGRHATRQRKDGITTPPDPGAINVTVFCDGHVKAVRIGDLTPLDLWSVSASRAWP